MYHAYEDYASGLVTGEMDVLRQAGTVRRIGVSIYNVEQLARVLEDDQIDVIQLPVNILDLDAQKSELLKKAKMRGKEIHARSVFLQGLFLHDPHKLTGRLALLSPYLMNLASLSNDLGVTMKSLALNFVLKQKFIDYVVLGVEKLDQLQENLSLVQYDFDPSVVQTVEVMEEHRSLLNPVNWNQ
jgi:aryl-alcohol dehydrogenase-like predicted oxidoreductase